MNGSNGRDRYGNSCAVGCSQCKAGREDDTCRLSASRLRGWRLALGASGVFVVPLMLAIAGAIVGGHHQVFQVTGAIAGFAIGIAVSGVIVKILSLKDEESVHG